MATIVLKIATVLLLGGFIMPPLDYSERKGGGQKGLKELMLTEATGVEPSQGSKETATKKP